MQHAFLAVLAISGVTRQLFAQSNDSSAVQPARPVFSMGQPRQWLPLASTFAVVGGGTSGGVGALLGVQRSVLNPITGLLSVSGEALGEWRRNESTAGLRLLANVPALGVGVGADWRARTGNVAALVTFQTAIRRGGLLGHGSMVRIDWLPARHQTVDVGIQLPLLQPFAGRTRPRRTIAQIQTADAAQPRSDGTASDALANLATGNYILAIPLMA